VYNNLSWLEIDICSWFLTTCNAADEASISTRSRDKSSELVCSAASNFVVAAAGNDPRHNHSLKRSFTPVDDGLACGSSMSTRSQYKSSELICSAAGSDPQHNHSLKRSLIPADGGIEGNEKLLKLYLYNLVSYA
jgi:hypothetical protein